MEYEKKVEKFSIKKRLKSFTFAYNGLKILFKTEHNAIIHLIAAIVVIVAGVIYNLSQFEWIVIIILIGLVFFAELINSSLEYLADAVSTEYNNKIGISKDLSAAAVLVISISAAIIGLVIFIPKIYGSIIILMGKV